ncbi:MAG: aminomethyl-transferring glycine dehydrogenase subunit GcvPB [Anaerolineales bacterium]|nr:MAG: aminomethyl-transferring glycine dehydrogenase subunit GcvPB [Anaerolineales bacterium]
MKEPLVYEISSPGRIGVNLPECDVEEAPLPQEFLRKHLALPEVSEVDLIRHYTRLSQLNHGVDTGFYPLGSCTMKYNPKVNEDVARLPGFVHTHPYQASRTVQGNLFLMYHLQEFLKEISGFSAVSLQPAAGAHGELAGVLMIRAYHESRGDQRRTRMLIPDSAHGTNPASTTMAGYETIKIVSDARGNVSLDDLHAHCDDTVAGMMLTNPNTLGLFDEYVLDIARMIHECGGLLYGDGANLNAIMGIVKPEQLGFDVMHFNLHKTFSTPHGGGGPGAGPVGASENLAPFLPGPIVVIERVDDVSEADEAWDEEGYCYQLRMPESSIGRLKAFYGNFGVCLKAYTYIRMLGATGLRQVSEHAVLNANYLLNRLKDVYPLPYDRTCMHEFVLSGTLPGAPGVHTVDIAKRLMDFGFHPPTVYFPLIVPEALMIEPTETESKETLDAFADALIQIAREAREDPELLTTAPHVTPVARLDEVGAARTPVLHCLKD